MYATGQPQQQDNMSERMRARSAASRWRIIVLIVTALATIVGPGAQAALVVHLNPAGPGHFAWYGGDDSSPIGLQMTLDAASQTGAVGGEAQFSQSNVPAEGRSTIAGNDDTSGRQLLARFIAPVSMLEPLAPGTLIEGTPPTDLVWSNFTYIYRAASGGSLLPENTHVYLGVKFPLADGMHYGWIRGVRQNTYEFDVVAWAYETEVGVPIEAGAGFPQVQGACCMPSGSCAIETEANCATAGGVYAGNDTDCKTANCPQPCPADVDPPGGNGAVDVDDLIAVILAWGPCGKPPAECPADVDDNGAVDVDDLIAVILGWGPCE